MNVFLDASALAKRYVEEIGSDRVDEILADASSLAISILAPTEVISALCRRRRERRLTRGQYGKAKNALWRDIADATVIGLSEGVLTRSVDLLERWPLRLSDALHVAAAAEWACNLFVSADDRQCAAATGYGLPVEMLSAGQ